MPPRLLFVPVSGAFGMGEYARSLNLALAFTAHRPDAQVHFVVSAQAPYAKNLPFDSTVLPSSPTFHTPEVCELIERMRPDIVVFDNAGRSAQLAAAHRAGARLVYISARPRQRRKAFRVGWMRMLDEHWIAYPEFIAGPVAGLERYKLAWLKRPKIRFLDCLLPPLTMAAESELFARTGVSPGGYVLCVPGGGTGHPRADDAAAVFRQAALELAASGVSAILVAPARGDRLPVEEVAAVGPSGFIRLDLLPLAELIALVRGAKAMLTNGGSTLLQAVGCRTPTISAPIASDQAARIKLCASRGLTRSVALNARDMVRAMRELLDDEPGRERMRTAAAAMRLSDASGTAVAALDGLLAARLCKLAH